METILIVDDEPQMLIAMNETIKRDGYSISTAGSGVEALERLKESQYRLVITDLRMPQVTGLDLLREQILLAVPLKVVCRDHCRGLCPHCGKNLNIEQCSCSEPLEDPRWEALKEIRKKLEQ